MFLQGWFKVLRTRRRRLAERRYGRHGAEITRRLQELLGTSQLIPPDSDSPRKPNKNDQNHARDKSRTALDLPVREHMLDHRYHTPLPLRVAGIMHLYNHAHNESE
jgi:hypothetical protein